LFSYCCSSSSFLNQLLYIRKNEKKQGTQKRLLHCGVEAFESGLRVSKKKKAKKQKSKEKQKRTN